MGNVPSDKGYLRHDANVVSVTGIEIDHDYKPGKISMSPEEAADRMRAAGVLCVIATTASHAADKPRRRLFAPLSVEYPPEYRRGFVAYVDNLLGGAAARESCSTLSQAYFVGKVEGVLYVVIPVAGRHVDELTEPVATPVADVSSAKVPEWHHVDLDSLPVLEEAKALIRDGAPQGQRSEALMSAANALARARVHPDDILRVLSDPEYVISAKALEGRRQTAAMEWLAKHTVRKALESFPPVDLSGIGPPPMFGPANERHRLLVSVDEMLARPRVPNWLVTGILEKHTLGMLFGDRVSASRSWRWAGRCPLQPACRGRGEPSLADLSSMSPVRALAGFHAVQMHGGGTARDRAQASLYTSPSGLLLSTIRPPLASFRLR